MMITGQKPIMKSKQGKFQIVDIVEMMKPLTKFTKQIVHANTIPSLIRESVRIAHEERPGAVHLELPEDVAAEEADDHIFAVRDYDRPEADTVAVEKAVKMIEQAKRPLLLIGAGANRKATTKHLEAFINKTQMLFFNTQMGKG